MSIVINDESIENLLKAREKFDEYLELKKDNPDSTSLKQNMLFELAKLGFSDYNNFKYRSASHNVYEFDRCYRVRHKDYPLTIEPPEMKSEDFCIAGSGCKDRGLTPCAHEFNMEFVRCYNNDQIFKFMSYEESLMCKEHYDAAKKLGLDTEKLYAPHPIGAIAHYRCNPQHITPKNCTGTCIKIQEPRFNVFWGMESYFDMGDLQWSMK